MYLYGISDIDRRLSPFYYWAFDNTHVLMAASIDYKDMTACLARLTKVTSVSELKWQCFDVRTDE